MSNSIVYRISSIPSSSTWGYVPHSAAVSVAPVIWASILACVVLTASLWVDIVLGIAVDFSVFLVMYQSVLANSFATFIFKSLIKLYFNPLVAISPSTPKSSISSCAVNKVSAWAFGVAVP